MKGMQSCIAYSIGKARRKSLTNKEGKKLPGPGIYKEGNMDFVKTAYPKWSLKGRGPGEKYEREVPGPGQYVNNYKKYNAPNFSFGGKFDKSFYQDTSSIPGPGSYQSPSTLGKKGGYLGLKNKIDKRNELPGPGAYGLKSTFSTRYGAPFGSGKRSSPNLNKTTTFPGPGSYQPMLSGRRTLGGGFGTSKRNDSAERGHAPGPGQYPINENLYRDQKAATIKGRPKTTKDDTKPGPGHYTSKSQHSSPMYSMGLKTKIKQIIGKDNPGPGGYNPDYK